VGAFGAVLLAAANKRLNWITLKGVNHTAALTIGMIFFIVMAATCFAYVFRSLGGDDVVSDLIYKAGLGSWGLLFLILTIVFVLGFFLDWIEITLIILPLVAPVVAALGFDLVWFTILFAVCLQTSFLTPPVGFAIFYLKGVAPPEIDTVTVYKGVAPFVLLQILGLVVIFNWEGLVTWLPAQAYGVAP
jgi:TRAP-type mannitol/chloroaromatic compound transport system permease large subunit